VVATSCLFLLFILLVVAILQSSMISVLQCHCLDFSDLSNGLRDNTKDFCIQRLEWFRENLQKFVLWDKNVIIVQIV